ncbi:MAG: DPP IV N-terminal domain-containing protein [Fidelibacterota bacterium]
MSRGIVIIIQLGLFLFCCSENPSSNDDKCKEAEYEQPVVPPVDEYPAWNPDDSIIAYIHKAQSVEELENGLYQIWFIGTDGEDNRFFRGGTYIDWSPDGKWLVFKFSQIYKIKVNGDSLTQLSFEGNNSYPAFSYDGRWIAYNRSVCEGDSTCGIWLINSNGEGNRFIIDYGMYPAWHPFSNQILYIRRVVMEGGQVLGDSVYVFDIENNENMPLFFLEGDNRYPKYSPDGEKIVFVSNAQIWVMDSDGSNLIQITTEGGLYPSWSPDGSQIVYLRYSFPTVCEFREYNLGEKGDGALWIMFADGTNQRQLTFISSGRY